MKKLFLCALAALPLSTFPVFAASVFAADKTPTAPTVTIGQPDATIKIDEYASLGCPHCQDFHENTLPQLKATYLDGGKVKIVYHFFPLDKASVDAALLVECVPPSQAGDVISLLYRQQTEWAHDPKYDDKLRAYGARLGLPQKTIDACLNDTKMRDAILQGRLDANKKSQVNATPTFIINGGAARLEGFQTFDQMAAVLNKM